MKKGLALAFLSKLALTPAVWAGTTGTAGIDVSKFAFQNLGDVINTFVVAAIILSGLTAFAFLIMGGFQYLTSGGDKTQAQAARDRITYAILGLAIVAAAVAIIQVIGAVFGINLIGNIGWPGPSGPTTGG